MIRSMGRKENRTIRALVAMIKEMKSLKIDTGLQNNFDINFSLILYRMANQAISSPSLWFIWQWGVCIISFI